jgi:hypothetical protein
MRRRDSGFEAAATQLADHAAAMPRHCWCRPARTA